MIAAGFPGRLLNARRVVCAAARLCSTQSGEALDGDLGIAEHRDSQRRIVCAPVVCGNGAGKADGIQVVGASPGSFFTLL